MANWTPWLLQDDNGAPLSPITNIQTLIENGILFKPKFDELEAEIRRVTGGMPAVTWGELIAIIKEIEENSNVPSLVISSILPELINRKPRQKFMKSSNGLINRPIGLEVDNTGAICTFTRLGFKANESANLESFQTTVLPWCAITRCILDDNGNVLKYANESGYNELATNGGQVMTKIPLFYYKLEPLVKEPSNSLGQVLTKFRIWICYTPRKGFSIPHIFIDGIGNIRDNIYIAAYESSLNTTTNKLESLPNKVVYKHDFGNIDLSASLNRGPNWDYFDIDSLGLLQYLFVIAGGNFETGSYFGKGNLGSAIINTGQTRELVNKCGYTGLNGSSSLNMFGMENIWSNIGTYIDNFKYGQTTFDITTEPSVYATEYSADSNNESGSDSIGYDYNVDNIIIPYNKSNTKKLTTESGLKPMGTYGIEIDYEANTVTRIGDAIGLNAGSDFNNISPWRDMKRIVIEGQIMVSIPNFYYKTEVIKSESNPNGPGTQILKERRSVSFIPKLGYKPAFNYSDGVKSKVYIGAYEGTLSTDNKLESIVGKQPLASKNKDEFRNYAKARNTGSLYDWGLQDFIVTNMIQYLFYIEYASLNSQTAIGKGVVDITDDGSTNQSIITGGTSSLGNLSGSASGIDGKVSISYRGIENLWGNIWKWVDGGIVENNSKLYAYITNDRSKYSSNTISDYTMGPIAMSKTNGYSTRISYNGGLDSCVLPTAVGGNATDRFGDYFYQNNTTTAITSFLLGGWWNGSSSAGFACWLVYVASGTRDRGVGGRLFCLGS